MILDLLTYSLTESGDVQAIVHVVDQTTGERTICYRVLSDVEIIYAIERASSALRKKYDRKA